MGYMSRTKWKGPYVEKQLLMDFKSTCSNLNTIIQMKSRRSTIIPQFVGFTFNVHNGNKFLKLKVTEEMIGHKFGEFSPTRKKFSFKKKNATKNYNGSKIKFKLIKNWHRT